VSTGGRELEKGGLWGGRGGGGAWAAVVGEGGGVRGRWRGRGRGRAGEQRQERKAGVLGGGSASRRGGGRLDGVRVWRGQEREETDGDSREIVGGGSDEVCRLLSTGQRALDLVELEDVLRRQMAGRRCGSAVPLVRNVDLLRAGTPKGDVLDAVFSSGRRCSRALLQTALHGPLEPFQLLLFTYLHPAYFYSYYLTGYLHPVISSPHARCPSCLRGSLPARGISPFHPYRRPLIYPGHRHRPCKRRQILAVECCSRPKVSPPHQQKSSPCSNLSSPSTIHFQPRVTLGNSTFTA